MQFTKDNMILAKYASKWILNIHNNDPVMDNIFLHCSLEIIGNHKELLDDIVDSIITNKVGKCYPDEARFYEIWCYLTTYSRRSGIQNLLRLMKKYPKSTSIVESIIVRALLENIKDIRADIKRHSIFKNLEIYNKLTNTECELILLLYTIINCPRIGLFIKKNTMINKDGHQFAEILGVEDSEAEKAEITVTNLGLMSYTCGKLRISPELIMF